MAKKQPTTKTSKSPAKLSSKSPAKVVKATKSPAKTTSKSPAKASKVVKAPLKTPAKEAKEAKEVKEAKESEEEKDETPAKSPAASKKPKGKIVSAPEFEDLNETALTASKKNSKTQALSTASLVPSARINKALSELQKFVETSSKSEDTEKTQLFEDELINDVQIILNKKDLFTSKKNFKPTFIQLEDAVLPKRSIALFVRDDLITKELLEQIEESELNNVLAEIIPGSELKTTYKQYEKRRELFSKYDLFLSDDALITSLPKLLGKVFYDSKKIPIPIRVNAKFSIESILNQVNNKVLKSIIYQTPRSNTLTINLGSVEDLTESTLHQVINHFSNQKLSAIYLKSNQSPSLPLYEIDTVYTAEDLAEDEEPAAKTVDDIELSTFEKGLVELAGPDSELVDLLATKKTKFAKKSNKQKAIAGKVTKPAAKPVAKSVAKPTAKPAAKAAAKVVKAASKPNNKKKAVKA